MRMGPPTESPTRVPPFHQQRRWQGGTLVGDADGAAHRIHVEGRVVVDSQDPVGAVGDLARVPNERIVAGARTEVGADHARVLVAYATRIHDDGAGLVDCDRGRG